MDMQAENTQAPEQTGPSPIEVDARAMGWSSKDEFLERGGKEERWVPAEQFVTLRQTAAVKTLQKQLADVTAALRAGQEAIAALKESNDATTRAAVERAREDLKAELKLARKEGDVDSEFEIREKLDQLDTAEKKAPPAQQAPQPAAPQMDPATVAWISDNPKFEQDEEWRAIAMAKATKLRTKGALDADGKPLAGRAFLDEVARQTNQFFAPKGGGTSDVAGGGATGNSGPRGKGFSDMPPEAQQFALKMIPKLVGKGRAYETDSAYKKHYAEQYFKQY